MKTKLTQEQKNRLIAEACGTAYRALGIRYKDGTKSFGQSEEYTRQKCANYQRQGLGCELIEEMRTTEDYFADLNACHDAWLNLPQDKKRMFEQNLQVVMMKSGGENDWLVCASATMRAEAIGLTMGLWS